MKTMHNHSQPDGQYTHEHDDGDIWHKHAATEGWLGYWVERVDGGWTFFKELT